MRPTLNRSLLTAILSLVVSTLPLLAQRTIRVPADAPSVQAAINSSVNGDTVLVSPGTYYENLNFNGHNITVQSTDGPASTTLDGGRVASTVKFISGEARAATISGFTIRNGDPAGLQIGGGIYVQNASPTILNNIITNNYCSGIASQQGSPLIRGNTITATQVGTLSCIYKGTPINLYLSNAATSSTVVDANVITDNLQTTYGAIQALRLYEVILQNNIIRNNIASLGNAQVAGIYLALNKFATVVGNEITGNTKLGSSSGAQSLYVLQDLVPDGYQAAFGAPTLRILNNTIIDGGPASAMRDPEILINDTNSRNLVANNIVSGPAISIDCDTGFVANPVFQNNLAGSYDADCHADASQGNAVTANPQLTANAGGDYVPNAASPAIDAGNNSVLPQTTTDFLGNARVQSAGATASIDLGAVERTAATATPQGRLAIAPARFSVLAGQAIDVTAALVNTGQIDTNPAAITLFLDGIAVQTASIVSTGTVTFTGIPIAAGVHDLYATTAATATIPATRSTTARVNGVTDPNTSPGVTTSLDERVVMEIDPLLTVGSQISAQVRCRLSSGSAINGDMRILDNGIAIVDSLNGGTNLVNATFFLQPGPHIYECDYSNGIYSSTVGAQLVAAGSATTGGFYSLPDPSEYGDAVTIGASAPNYDPSQNGHVRITEGTTVILDAALDSTGDANTVTTSLTPGVHSFQATVTTSTGISSGSFTQTVHYAPTRITLAAGPTSAFNNVPITLTIATTSSYTGTPITGAVTLQTGSTFLSIPGVVNGTVTLPAGALPIGVNVLTANYVGNSIFGPSTSNAVTVTITAAPPPDFSIAPTAPALSLMAEHHATATLTLASINNFNGTVRLACNNLPVVATCTFDRSSYTVTPGATTPVSLLVETSAIPYFKSQAEPASHGLRPILWALPAPLLLLLTRRKSLVRTLTLLAATAALSLGITACSGKYPAFTPPGTYNVTVTATGTSGNTAVTHTVPFRLTVTPE